MDKKVIFFLNYIWTAVIAFSFPICFELIFLHITGNTKGYGYALGNIGVYPVPDMASIIFSFILLCFSKNG